ncbi:hypothetical protein Hanom_Chr03g00246371 [Helianthus anomalus]
MVLFSNQALTPCPDACFPVFSGSSSSSSSASSASLVSSSWIMNFMDAFLDVRSVLNRLAETKNNQKERMLDTQVSQNANDWAAQVVGQNVYCINRRTT